MLFLLSPAKSLDYDTKVSPRVAASATLPQFLPRTVELIDVLKRKSIGDIAALMQVSHPLATLNVERYGLWSEDFTAANSRPAVLAFNGDVYEGLQAKTLSSADLQWAQQHLAILSGLYGVLRPLDLLQPYRLEMGTSLATTAGDNLYAFWGDTLAEHLNDRLAADRSPVIINLASQEYFRSVRRPVLRARVVDCVFEDWKGGDYKIISFFAKRARGLMARHAVRRRIATPAGLKGFAAEGYAYAAAASAPDRLVFRRRRDGDDTPEPVDDSPT